MIIYSATNKINNKQYVGLTTQTLEQRISGHKTDSKFKPNIKFYRAVNKYGFENFEFRVIEKDIESLEELKQREKYWIKKLDTYKNGYNSTFGGDDSPMWHEDIRKKVSLSQRGKEISKETREKLSMAHLGKKGTPHTSEHRLYMSNIMRGKKKSPEHVEKLRKASTGKKQSKETVEKRMKHIRGIKKKPEHARKLTEILNKNRFIAKGADHPRSVSINQLDLNTGKIINSFETISDAESFLGKKRGAGTISRCLSGYNKHAYGYGWERVAMELEESNAKN